MIRINFKQPQPVETPSTGMMYLPNYLPILEWDWESINYEVYSNQLSDSPPGPREYFVEWCVGWRKGEPQS